MKADRLIDTMIMFRSSVVAYSATYEGHVAIISYMKSSKKSSSRSWLLEFCILSSVCRSSYMWSFCHLS